MSRSIISALCALFILSAHADAEDRLLNHEPGAQERPPATSNVIPLKTVPNFAYGQSDSGLGSNFVFTHFKTGAKITIPQQTWEELTSPGKNPYSIIGREFQSTDLPRDVQATLKKRQDTESSFMLFTENPSLSRRLEATKMYTLDLEKLMQHAHENDLFVKIATFFSRYDNQHKYVSSKCSTPWLKMIHHKERLKEKAQTFWQHNQFRITGLFYMGASLAIDYSINYFFQSDTLDHYPPLSTLYALSMGLQLFNHRDKRDAIQAGYALAVYGLHYFRK